MILNLPATVEMATPNVYADQIEWFSRRLRARECAILSAHPHNDRGTAVAAAELALLAGAERVEGTLFGNGERTGNVDVVTLALNLYTQGIDPGLDCSDIGAIRRIVEELQPASGPPAASVRRRAGVHGVLGDRTRTRFARDSPRGAGRTIRSGRCPYLPIDPADVGRAYEPVIRINSQSGKGGVAHVLEADFGLRLPRGLQIELAEEVQAQADRDRPGDRVAAAIRCGLRAGVSARRAAGAPRARGGGRRAARGRARSRREAARSGEREAARSRPSSTLCARGCGVELRVVDYAEHALGDGADAVAMAYVEVETPGGDPVFGAGRSASLLTASLEAVVSAANRALRRGSLARSDG